MSPTKAPVKFLSGFCGMGMCEATAPKSMSGKPMKVCVAWQQCSCKCHEKLTQMFALSGAERIPVQNPAYTPYTSNIMAFIEQLNEERAWNAVSGNNAPAPEQKIEGTLLATSGKKYAPTERGRAPGQLEDEIRTICNNYTLGKYDDDTLCTPKFVQSQITPTPSIGAIGQAFTAWSRIGFAVVAPGPVRFITFTAEGMTKGLAAMKAEHKARKR